MIVLFDAVGTVIRPTPGVTEVYFRFGQKHGSQLQRWQIQERILEARRKFFSAPQVSLPLATNPIAVPVGAADFESDEVTERALWQSLVFDVFTELDSPADLFDELWQYFGQHDSWRVYDDVAMCWEALKERGALIGLASNFDSRLVSIAENLSPLPSTDFVFCSSQVGYRKPSQLFFQQVESAVRCVTEESIGEIEIYMIGDDFENDYVAPRTAGWNAVWLDRESTSDSTPNVRISDHHRVNSLEQFTRWIID